MRQLLYTLFCALVAMVGYEMHGSIGWAIVDFLFAPIVLIYWLVTQQITADIIKQTFSWFFE